MADPKKPEADATIVVREGESSEGRSDEPRKRTEDPGLETYVTPPVKPESPKSDPGGMTPPAPPPSPPVEKNVGKEPAPKSPIEQPPVPPLRQEEGAPAKKRGSGGLVLCIILLLVIGAGVLLFLRQSNQGSSWSQWFPFKWGSGQQQEAAQNAPAGIQGALSAPSPKHEWVQAGMPAQTVRDIMGEPLRVGQSGQMLQWEYDAGSELFIVRFQDDKVYDKGMVPYPSTADSRPAQTPSTQSAVEVPQLPQTTQTLPLSTSPGAGAGPESVSTVPQQDSGVPRYDQVRMGMTPEAVKGILGEPSEVKKVGRAIEWEYDTGTGYFEVRFRRNKVIFKDMSSYHTPKTAQTTPPATVPPSTAPVASGPPAGVAPAPSDYGKITLGMTPEAVTQILGKPALVKKLRVSIEWEYETPQGTFEVRFRNNRVSWKGMASHPSKTGKAAAPASNARGRGSFSPEGGGAN